MDRHNCYQYAALYLLFLYFFVVAKLHNASTYSYAANKTTWRVGLTREISLSLTLLYFLCFCVQNYEMFSSIFYHVYLCSVCLVFVFFVAMYLYCKYGVLSAHLPSYYALLPTY